LHENIRILKDLFPNVHWQLPKEPERARKGPQPYLNVYECGTSLCADVLVVVQPHKTLDKNARVMKALGHPFEYEFGRIQITLPKELIGLKANVRIEFPNTTKPEKWPPRGRKVLDYHQLGEPHSFSRKSQSEQAGT
jgi:hypothetical protein